MQHFLLFYELTDDYMARRAEFRASHLALAWAASDRGDLLLAGALGDPAAAAVLLFQGETSDVAEGFARTDPYVVNGLVKRWHVRPWTTVVGPGSMTPIRG